MNSEIYMDLPHVKYYLDCLVFIWNTFQLIRIHFWFESLILYNFQTLAARNLHFHTQNFTFENSHYSVLVVFEAVENEGDLWRAYFVSFDKKLVKSRWHLTQEFLDLKFWDNLLTPLWRSGQRIEPRRVRHPKRDLSERRSDCLI